MLLSTLLPQARRQLSQLVILQSCNARKRTSKAKQTTCKVVSVVVPVVTHIPIVSELASEIKKNANIFLNENFTLTSEFSTFEIEQLMNRKFDHGFVTTVFNQMKPFNKMRLTSEALRIQNTPNAGGSSIESETLSFELLSKFLNARLLKTEMEVTYFPEGGSITDYVVKMFDRIVGVSVTRAMKFGEAVFTNEDAHALLRKKLKGIKNSSKNTLIKWDKQVLHVWIYDEAIAVTLWNAWHEIEEEVRANTVVMLTVAKDSRELFFNTVKKTKAINKRRRTC